MRHPIFSLSRTVAMFATAATIGLVGGSNAAAQTTTVTYERTFGSPENRAIVQYSTPLNGVADVEFDVYAGSQNLSLTNFAPPEVRGYCIDLLGVLGQNPVVPFEAEVRAMTELAPGNPSPVSTSLRGAGAAWLFNNTVTGNNNRDSAALQLAIWEVLYDWNETSFASLVDGGIDLTPGDGGNFAFKHTPVVGAVDAFVEPDAVVTADIRARAEGFLLAWGGQLSDAVWLDTSEVTGPLQEPQGRIRQDLITTTINSTAPEPGTLALCLLPLLPLTRLALRQRRRQAD